MKETVTNLSKKIAGLEFDQPALEASFAQMGKPVEPKFVCAMRRTLGQYAGAYREDLAAEKLRKVRVEDIGGQPNSPEKTALLFLKRIADDRRVDLANTRKAFVLLGQGRAVLGVEVAVATNYIKQDLGK